MIAQKYIEKTKANVKDTNGILIAQKSHLVTQVKYTFMKKYLKIEHELENVFLLNKQQIEMRLTKKLQITHKLTKSTKDTKQIFTQRDRFLISMRKKVLKNFPYL